jgi:circadian clock protein KaiC
MSSRDDIPKLPTGIPGFDNISEGGLPLGRSTLVFGSTGSAKTTFAVQFLAEGIRQRGEAAVMVTFEERPEDICRNVASFGWELAQWEREGKLAFVDASFHAEGESMVTGDYDLGGLLARIEHALKKVGAVRLAMDSTAAVFTRLRDQGVVRYELFRIVNHLKNWGVTSLLTHEWPEFESARPSGAEEFVTDNVVVLRNLRQEEKRHRTIEILKFRGTTHYKGEYPFSILPDRGVMVIPLSSLEMNQGASDQRVSSGIPRLDEMCGGGFFRDSIILVSGATGTGKTLLSAHFIDGAVKRREKVLVFAFEESRCQLLRNAEGWGFDFRQMEAQGLVKLCCRYPETASLEDQLISMRHEIEAFNPQRVAIDSLSALERVASSKGFRELESGQQALCRLRDRVHDVMQLDIQMPGMSGYGVLEALRKQERLTRQRPIPVVALTAHCVVGELERAMKAGMDGFLTKPVERGLLGQTLVRLFPNEPPS